MPKKRPDILHGATRRVATGCGNLYITINRDEDGRPVEVWGRLGKAGGCAAAQIEAVCSLLAMLLSLSADAQEIVHRLKGIRCHNSADDKPSCAHAVATALELELGLAEAAHGKSKVRPQGQTGAADSADSNAG
jgi:ribonucleoside-diphosphate reductase alpha chain